MKAEVDRLKVEVDRLKAEANQLQAELDKKNEALKVSFKNITFMFVISLTGKFELY